jgi:hypothetical protein
LFDDDHTLPRYNPVVPKSIIRIFNQGWRTQFSILMLTDNYVLSPEALKSSGDKILLGHGNSLYTQAPDPVTMVAGRLETSCTFEEYMEAMPRFVDLVRDYLGPNLADAWQVHFSNVVGVPFRSKVWHLLIRYDIEIRRLGAQRGFRPQNWHEEVYTGIKERWEREEFENRIARLDAAITTAHAQAGRTANNQPPVYHSRSKVDSLPPYKPQTLAGPSKVGQYSFQGEANATGANAVEPHDPKKAQCFNCGRESHVATKCRTYTMHNGSRTILTRAPDGKNWLLDGASFCYNFNSHKGCAGTACPRGPHKCSLCRSVDHGAFTCASVSN